MQVQGAALTSAHQLLLQTCEVLAQIAHVHESQPDADMRAHAAHAASAASDTSVSESARMHHYDGEHGLRCPGGDEYYNEGEGVVAGGGNELVGARDAGMLGRARHQSGGEGSQGGRVRVGAFLGAEAACVRISADALRVFVDETLCGLGSVRWCVARIPPEHRLSAQRVATQALVLAIKQVIK